MCIDGVHFARTYSNNCVEVFNVLRIEAARGTIMKELQNVIEFDGSYLALHRRSIYLRTIPRPSTILVVGQLLLRIHRHRLHTETRSHTVATLSGRKIQYTLKSYISNSKPHCGDRVGRRWLQPNNRAIVLETCSHAVATVRRLYILSNLILATCSHIVATVSGRKIKYTFEYCISNM